MSYVFGVLGMNLLSAHISIDSLTRYECALMSVGV